MSAIHSANAGLTRSQGPDSPTVRDSQNTSQGGPGARKLKGFAGFLVSHYASSSLKATQNPGVSPVLILQEFGFERHRGLAVKELSGSTATPGHEKTALETTPSHLEGATLELLG